METTSSEDFYRQRSGRWKKIVNIYFFFLSLARGEGKGMFISGVTAHANLGRCWTIIEQKGKAIQRWHFGLTKEGVVCTKSLFQRRRRVRTQHVGEDYWLVSGSLGLFLRALPAANS